MPLLREPVRPMSILFRSLAGRIFLGGTRGSAVLRTALVSIATRGFSVLASLLTVPLVLHHLGRERYGVWMAAIALSTLFALADGGVTKGLIAEVSKAHGAGDRARIAVLVSSAMASTMVFVVVFLVLVLAAIAMVDWIWAFNLSSQAIGHEAAATVAIICVSYALTFPATVIRETRLGLLQGAVVNAWDLGGLIAGFAGLICAVQLGLGLVAIAAIWVAGPLLARMASAISFLAGEGRDLMPKWSNVSAATNRLLIATGSVFMLYIATQALAVQSDQILIARFLGADAVTDYSIVQRLFNQPQILVTLALAAQWPAYGEALGAGDILWIRRNFTRSLIGYTALAIIVSGLLGLFCNAILKVWVGNAVVAPPFLIAAMTVYGVIATIANVFAFFFMSLSMHKLMIATQVAMFAINLPLSIWLLPHVGTAGAIIGTTAGYLFAIVLPGWIMRDRIFAQLPQLRGNST